VSDESRSADNPLDSRRGIGSSSLPRAQTKRLPYVLESAGCGGGGAGGGAGAGAGGGAGAGVDGLRS